jgi:dihydrodipicolinate synthase/N-acetylneuraminate lyase
MKTDAVTHADFSASVLAVPPLARNPDLSLNRDENTKLIRHIEGGGITTFLYGGNANFYNVGLYEYAAILDFLAETAAKDSWVIPSVGPDFGKMMDQAKILRERAFPTAMVLPLATPASAVGVEDGLRRFADAYRKPIILYLKFESYLTPQCVQRLIQDGVVAGIKYAVVRKDPKNDAYLSELIQLVDKGYIVSGIGEKPAIVHLRDFGLNGFTSGSCCVAPYGSQRLLRALKNKDYEAAEQIRKRYLKLEFHRDNINPIRVLHEAVTLSGIADMGPILPLLSNLESRYHKQVKEAATMLLQVDAMHRMAA